MSFTTAYSVESRYSFYRPLAGSRLSVHPVSNAVYRHVVITAITKPAHGGIRSYVLTQAHYRRMTARSADMNERASRACSITVSLCIAVCPSNTDRNAQKHTRVREKGNDECIGTGQRGQSMDVSIVYRAPWSVTR